MRSAGGTWSARGRRAARAALRAGAMRRWAGRLPCPRAELRLELVLRCGQAFRWRESSPGHWTGVLAGRVWTLTQTDEQLCYTVYEEEEGGSCKELPQSELQPAGSEAPGSLYSEAPALEPLGGADSCEAQRILSDYFQLDVNLAALYQAWGTVDPHFQQVAANFPGVRVLRQDPVECLFSFLCTSNNHLARITGMIERLCQAFGRRLCQLDMQPYHAFPSLQALARADTEGRLRALGFGYRARFVCQSAQAVLEQFGTQGLHQLRSVPYPEAKRLLCTLPGVGAKVADCVCLMALDKTEAVPVDTHVWQIAQRDYSLQLGTGAHHVPGRRHSQLGDFFRRLWGPYAGWAQAVLFCADLKLFQQVPGPWEDPAAALAPRGPTNALEARGQHRASPATTQTLGPGSAPAPWALPGKRRRGENSCTRPGPQP